LKERIEGIVDVSSSKDHQSRIIERPDKPNGTQFVLDIRKTVNELGYVPHYSWHDYLLDFKKEMEEQRFAKIWGVEDDYISKEDISRITMN